MFFAIFRDNGISIQILMYQLYCEVFLFLLTLVFFIMPIETNLMLQRIMGLINNVVVFIVQPLFEWLTLFSHKKFSQTYFSRHFPPAYNYPGAHFSTYYFLHRQLSLAHISPQTFSSWGIFSRNRIIQVKIYPNTISS